MNKSFRLILLAIALAMGVSSLVLNVLHELEISTAFSLLSISVICLTIVQLQKK